MSKWMQIWVVALAAGACAKRVDESPGKTGSPGKPGETQPGVSQPGQLPSEQPKDLAGAAATALKVAVGDLDGDGRPEIVLADPFKLRVVDKSGHITAETDLNAGIEALVVADADGDGHKEILAGWGRSREFQDALARITIHRLQGNRLVEEVLAAPRTGRQDVAAIVPAPDRLLVAYYANKYEVLSSYATVENGAWRLAPIATLRMATSYAIGDVDGDGQADLVVGRVYGDDQDAPGDAFVLRPDGTRVPIPTTRGVRGLAIVDLDGDGKNEIYLGDGWDKNYGKVAQGLLTRAKWDGKAFQSSLVENTAGQFTIWKILGVDVDGDGHPELVTQGTKYARAYRLQGGAWQAVTFGGANPRDIATGELDGQPGDDVVVVGEKTEIASLRDAKWAPLPPAAALPAPQPAK